jgi:hypothetical protein
VFAIFYFLTVFHPTKKLLIETKHELRLAKADQQTHPQPIVTIKATPAQQLVSFTANFPAATSINGTWGLIMKLADKSGLNIDHAAYESSKEQHAGLVRYNLNLPVQATYPQLRDFLTAVIATIPNIALDQLTFKRESVDNPSVDANINFVLFVRAE